MNACTETAPDIRVAGPLRDFLVRAFAPFNLTGATEERRKNGGSEGRHYSSSCEGRRDSLYRGHRPWIRYQYLYTPLFLLNAKTWSTSLKFRVESRFALRNESVFKQKQMSCDFYRKNIRQERINHDIIFLIHNLCYIQKNV